MNDPARLSPNFRVSEIFEHVEPTDEQLWLARHLCETLLEPIRSCVGTPIFVSDGARSWSRHNLLEARGYNPYRYSDHSFMLDWNWRGVGAVDILKLVQTRQGNLARSTFIEDDYDAIVSMFGVEDPLPYGQLIWYRKRGHIHVSNPRWLVFTDAFIRAYPFPRRQATYVKEA